jgi:ribosome-associated protein
MPDPLNTAPAARPPVDADLEIEDVLALAASALDEKKGENLLVLDVSEQVDYLDYLILVTGQTEIHNQSLARNLVDTLSRYDIMPDGLNGQRSGDWILVDYGVFVVHIFLSRLRDFYRLEELWAGGREVELSLA